MQGVLPRVLTLVTDEVVEARASSRVDDSCVTTTLIWTDAYVFLLDEVPFKHDDVDLVVIVCCNSLVGQ